MCNLTHTVIQNFVTRIPIGKVMAYGEVAEKLCTEPRAGAKYIIPFPKALCGAAVRATCY